MIELLFQRGFFRKTGSHFLRQALDGAKLRQRSDRCVLAGDRALIDGDKAARRVAQDDRRLAADMNGGADRGFARRSDRNAVYGLIEDAHEQRAAAGKPAYHALFGG